MNLKRLFSSSPPATGWMLDTTVAAVIRRESSDRVSYAAAAIPEGVLEVGPVGLQAVAGERLYELLAPLHEQVKGGRKVSVVVPSIWVRTHLMDFDHLPRRRNEVDDVVRWRLKKLLPVPPAQLRLVAVPLPAAATGNKRLLCMVGLESALAELEAAFDRFGAQPCLITPRHCALVESRTNVPYRLLIQQEAGFLSLVLLENGTPSLIRTKPLPEPHGPWQVVVREQHMALDYVREELAISATIQVAITAEAAEIASGLSAWWSDQEGVELEAPPELIPGDQPDLAAQLGTSRLAPVYALLGGLAR
jgi:hypothetical protein